MSSNFGQPQNQATEPCTSQSSLSQTSDNLQFHIIKLEDLNKSRNRNYCLSPEKPTVYLNSDRTHQINLDLQMQGFKSISSSNIIRFKSKPKCPMCYGSSTAYYCATCVRNGNFYHSNMKLPERFAEKRIRERRLQQFIATLELKAPAEMAQCFKKDNLKREIEDLKERIELIKKVVHSEKQRIKKAKEEEIILKAHISHLRKTIPAFQTKNSQILQNISLYTKRIPEKKTTIDELECLCKLKVSSQISELTSFIFPISTEVSDTREECLDSSNEETVKELAEASQTYYVKGRWITTTHYSEEANYKILSLTLPGSGDYTSFIRPYSGAEVCQKKKARNICAGLTYLCQMVNILAFYLSIHLPKKITFSDFSDFSQQEMRERKFQTLLSRLNQNVIYLCISQGIQPNLLYPLRALPNIIALLTDGRAEPGRTGSFEFPESILDSLEIAGCNEDVDSESDDDWENITHVPQAEFLSQSPARGFYRGSSVEESATGIVTSAAASVMSIFKGIGNPMK